VRPAVRSRREHRTHTFHTTLALDSTRLVDLGDSLMSWLENAGVAYAARTAVVSATHEAAANAIEHSGSIRPIDVRARLAHGTLKIEVSDHGRWTSSAPADPDRGAGLPRIAGLVTRVTIEKGRNGTTLRLIRHV
jgi:anti-sigma regulatory factor (Ser/Thr protein kinase)